MFLIYDTETTTFPLKGVDAFHKDQARIIQLAWIILDEQFKERTCFKALVNPSGEWFISDGAFKAHGISKPEIENFGIPSSVVMPLFIQAFCKNRYHVGHNIQFDKQLVDIECMRHDKSYHNGEQQICTMQLMTPICKIPNPNPRGGLYKWPKLGESYKYCTGQELTGAHDALVDVRACATVFRWLIENRHVTV